MMMTNKADNAQEPDQKLKKKRRGAGIRNENCSNDEKKKIRLQTKFWRWSSQYESIFIVLEF